MQSGNEKRKCEHDVKCIISLLEKVKYKKKDLMQNPGFCFDCPRLAPSFQWTYVWLVSM